MVSGMNPIHALASHRHLCDHIAPLWLALDPKERGTFFATNAMTAARAREHGIKARTSGRIPSNQQPAWVIVASFGDYQKVGRRPAVMVEHGAGQCYGADEGLLGHSPYYSGGAKRQRVGLFLCPSERVAARNRRQYPETPCIAAGSPRLDRFHVTLPLVRQAVPTVAITFHWNANLCAETRWAYPHFRSAVSELAARQDELGIKLIGHGHPRAWRVLKRFWDELGIESVQHAEEVFERADCLVADNTSLIYEMASLDRPVVVLNAPWYRRDINHGIRFWEYADVGIQCDEPDQLIDAVICTLSEDPQAQRRREISEAMYFALDGKATERSVEALRLHLP